MPNETTNLQPSSNVSSNVTSNVVSMTGGTVMGKMRVYYNDGFCGSGKTHWMIDRIVTKRGKYIIANDRIETIDERIEAINKLIAARKLHPIPIHEAHSETGDAKGETTLAQTYAAIQGFANSTAAVVFITHATLKRLCLDGIDVSDWVMMIDEVPNVLEQGQHKTPNSLKFLNDNYDLQPSYVHQGLHEISFARNHITTSDVRHDDAHKGFANLHRHIQSGHSVYTTIGSWAAEVDKSKKPWVWASLWSMNNLRNFKEIYLLGNSFEESISYHLLSTVFARTIDLQKIQMPPPRQWLRRPVTIEYFTDDHCAGNHYFHETPEGKNVVSNIGNVLAKTKGGDHIWSGNLKTIKALQKKKIKGTKLDPKQAGSNGYADVHNASFIYAAKQSPAEQAIHTVLGISRNLVWRDREMETIIQFIMRISLRDPFSTEHVIVALYDKWQADFAKTYLDKNYGFNCALTCLNHDGKFTRTVEPAAYDEDYYQLSEGEKSRIRTQNYRERIRDEQIANGTYRGKGRPKGSTKKPKAQAAPTPVCQANDELRVA